MIKQIHASWVLFARKFDGIFPTPGLVQRLPDPALGRTHPGRGPEDVTQNTTANLYSMCIMQNYLSPDLLVGATEPSEFVNVHETYDYEVYDPTDNIWWDSSFSADLTERSHVSYAHPPLHGSVKRKLWREIDDPKLILLGNRGPLNGDVSVESITKKIHLPHDRWSGNICFADNSVSFFDSLAAATNSGLNPFAPGRGVIGEDPFITFTKEMTAVGPVIQHD